MKTKPSKKRVVGLAAALAFLIPAVTMAASIVAFDNQSGKSALVKLVGPTASSVTVENSKKESVSVASGHYYIKVRYGAPGAYTYSKGDEFDATSTSEITITLHKVATGNYGTTSISEAEFGREEHDPVAKDTVQGMEPLLPASIVDSDAATEAHLKIGWKVFGDYHEWYDTQLSKDEQWRWETKGAPDSLSLYYHDSSRPVPKEGAFAVIVIEFMAKRGTPILEYTAAKGTSEFPPSLLIGAHFDPNKQDTNTPLPGIIDNSPVGRDRRAALGENLAQMPLDGGKGVRVCFSKDTTIRALWFLSKEHCDKKEFTVLLLGYKPIRFTVPGASSSAVPVASKTGK